MKTADHVSGVITLFQHKEAPNTQQQQEGEDEHSSSRPVSHTPLPLSVLRPPQAQAATGGVLATTQSDSALLASTALTPAALMPAAVTPAAAVDIYVDTLVDGAANASLCVASLDPASATEEGQCSLRSAVAACEALLQTPSTALCSVHLPAVASCRITMQPELGEVLLQGQGQGDVPMNGTVFILGNGCHISPNASVVSTRFLNINGGVFHTLNFLLSNMTISHFGSESLSGGAVLVQSVMSLNSSRIEHVEFLANTGYFGGACRWLSPRAALQVT